MSEKETYQTIEDYIAALSNEASESSAVTSLKNYEGTDDAIIGLQLFMEHNSDDVALLSNFLTPSELTLEQLNSSKPKTIYPIFKIAAMVAIILGSTLSYFLLKPDTNYYAKYAEKDIGLPVYMSHESDKLDAWMLDYKEGNFEKAKSDGERLLLTNPKSDTIHYYLGVIYSELGEVNDAEKEFHQVREQSGILSEKAKFLEAICLLNSNKKKAKIIFEDIAGNPEHYYSKQAKRVLNEIF